MPAPEPRTPLSERTPLTEWIAAGLGLILTLLVIGYALREGLSQNEATPELTVTAEPAEPSGQGFVLPITVANASPATAAAVEVSGRLERPDASAEERRASFAYVPGKGEAKGGLVFESDPRAGSVTLRVEGYEEP